MYIVKILYQKFPTIEIITKNDYLLLFFPLKYYSLNTLIF